MVNVENVSDRQHVLASSLIALIASFPERQRRDPPISEKIWGQQYENFRSDCRSGFRLCLPSRVVVSIVQIEALGRALSSAQQWRASKCGNVKGCQRVALDNIHFCGLRRPGGWVASAKLNSLDTKLIC